MIVDEAGFPLAPWDRDGLIAAADDDGLAALERWALNWHGAPRCDPDLARQYCREVLPPGRVLLYGAGSHSAWLLEILKTAPHLNTVGVVDRMAPALPVFHGLPVYTPAALHAVAADYVLIAHTSLEQEMTQTLVAAGYPPAKIVTFYAAPAYAALSKARIDALANSPGPESVDNIIIQCTHSGIVPDHVLADLGLQGRTLNILIGRASGLESDFRLNGVDLLESTTALKLLLKRTRPRIIYVRTILYKNFLLPLIKLWAPYSIVIGEPYDMTILWSDDDLNLLFGLNAETIRMQRLGELLAGQKLDMLISKRGGELWKRIAAAWRAPCLMYFPALQPRPDPPLAPGTEGDIVYAGFFPAAAFLKEFRSGYNFVPLLTDICREGNLVGALYNGAHIPNGGDHLFAEYSATLQGPLHYHPRLPYAEMLRVLTGFRYGWLCDHRDRFQGDRYVGVCNRWTGYISAGLPVLIDDGWSFMVDLTRRFGAGLIVTELTPAAVLGQIQTADWSALRDGALRLRLHLESYNQEVLAQLAACLESADPVTSLSSRRRPA